MSGVDVVEFLRARLDEDERIAREAAPGRRLTYTAEPKVYEIPPDTPLLRHQVNYDPARVLREVEALRRIVDEHHPVDPCDAHDASFRSISCDTLRALAAIWADHEDFQEEWRADSS